MLAVDSVVIIGRVTVALRAPTMAGKVTPLAPPLWMKKLPLDEEYVLAACPAESTILTSTPAADVVPL
jgi:hypothetical protein